MAPDDSYHLHLVSDATGETTHGVARACLAQFEGVRVIEHLWPMVRSKAAIQKVLDGVKGQPGAVIFTLINEELRGLLQRECARLQVPCISVLDPVMYGLASYFGKAITGKPGRQHELDAEYFDRIDAMNFAMTHDDGQSTWDLNDADLVLVGVSRTSKTPTSMYLANHFGIKTANIPFVPSVPLPVNLFDLTKPLIVGLTASPERLVQIRRNRLLMLRQEEDTDYVDIDTVKEEIGEARKVFSRSGWPVIDVTRRSIEETASSIYQLYAQFRNAKGAEAKPAPEG